MKYKKVQYLNFPNTASTANLTISISVQQKKTQLLEKKLKYCIINSFKF